MFFYFLAFSFLTLTQKAIIFDPVEFKWQAYENNTLVKEGPASGGKNFCPDIGRKCKTPSGIFNVLSKRGKYYRSPLYPINCNNNSLISKEKCAPMPWAVKFLHSGESLHSSNDDWNNIKNRSHGCIHLKNEDAEWINKWIRVGDKVVVLPY